MGKNILIGCVADDFTGASDAASFLVKAGLNTVLFNGVPEDTVELNNFGAIVIAMKTRSDESKKAVKDSLEAFTWLKELGCKHLYSKYCSTFDSTKEGNIGPILDAVLENFNEKAAILCPALPVNKRIVKDGCLYVDGVLLHESSMKNHPINPMWEADIEKLMKPQSKYPCIKVNYDMLELTKDEIQKEINDYGKDKEHFYIVPDYITDVHAVKIAEVFGDMGILSGGSGILTSLALKYKKESNIKENKCTKSQTSGNAIILAGSCSVTTLKQIEKYRNSGKLYYKIDPIKLLNEELTIDDIWRFICLNKESEILIYSSDSIEKIIEVQKQGKEKVAKILEGIMGELARRAVDSGFKRIIVAGGETSGAVTKRLQYDAYIIGESIAPGVPIMTPLKDQEIRLILKSGNFGQTDFFERALNMTRE